MDCRIILIIAWISSFAYAQRDATIALVATNGTSAAISTSSTAIHPTASFSSEVTSNVTASTSHHVITNTSSSASTKYLPTSSVHVTTSSSHSGSSSARAANITSSTTSPAHNSTSHASSTHSHSSLVPHSMSTVASKISPAPMSSSYVPYASTVAPTGTTGPHVIYKCGKECRKLKKQLYAAGIFAVVFLLISVVLGLLLYRQVKINQENSNDPALSRLI